MKLLIANNIRGGIIFFIPPIKMLPRYVLLVVGVSKAQFVIEILSLEIVACGFKINFNLPARHNCAVN